MAMMISKFHRLIQSRLLWIVFLVVIVFSFVIWGMQMPDADRQREDPSPGILDGEPVPPDEFRAAYRHELVGLTLMFGRDFRLEDEMEQFLREAAWRRLIGWREADRLEITVSDREVLRAIRQEQAFFENGTFSLDRYRQLLQGVLGHLGMNERHFEEYLRGELKTRKLAAMLQLSTLAMPGEVKRAAAHQTEQLRVAYLAVPAERVADDVEVNEDDARRVFARHPDAYRVPPRVQLRYVRFDAEPHRDQVGPFAEEDIEDYFAEHNRQFSRFDFEMDEDGQPMQPRPVIPPFEDVRDEVIERMTLEAARSRAREEADRFLRLIAPYFTARPLSFEDAAQQLGIDVLEAEPVARDGRIPGTTAPRSATEAAFALQQNPEEYFTDPFAGETAVYVFALQERLPAFVPPFEDVRTRALDAARAERVAEAQRTLAAQAGDRLKTGEAIEKVAEALGLDLHELEPFTPAQGPDRPQARVLRDPVAALNSGGVTDPVRSTDGAVLVARLNERRTGDPDEVAEAMPGLSQQLRAAKANLAFHTWLQDLLERHGFEDRAPDTVADEDDMEV